MFIESIDSNAQAPEERHAICRSSGAWDVAGRFYKHVAPLALEKQCKVRAARIIFELLFSQHLPRKTIVTIICGGLQAQRGAKQIVHMDVLHGGNGDALTEGRSVRDEDSAHRR
jgi:hypothetical protein